MRRCSVDGYMDPAHLTASWLGFHDAILSSDAQEVQDHNIFEKGDVDTSMLYP